MREQSLRSGLRTPEILLLAVWLGLTAGLGEVGRLLIRMLWLHQYVHRPLDFVWMAPISVAIICCLAAAVLCLLLRSGGSTPLAALPFMLLGFLALFDLLPNIPKVLPAARTILVLGVAVQAGLMAARHSTAIIGVVRRTLAPIGILVALLFVGLRGSRWVIERRALGALPAAPSGAPNILLLVLDTVRAMDLSLYGYARVTSPALDQLATQGVVFERAYSTSSWTLPSHASIFTGRLPFATGAGWLTPLDPTLPTLAAVLQRRGYATGGFSANSYVVSWETGVSRGFLHFDDYPGGVGALLVSSRLGQAVLETTRKILPPHQLAVRKETGELRQEVLAWLEQRPRNRPFFVFVNAFDAHGPYLPRPPFDTAFTGHRIPWDRRNPFLNNPRPITRAEAATERDAYDQALATQDHEIGTLLQSLKQSGALENTLIVVTADHGEEFGRWGLIGHGNSLNPSALWVPLVLSYPGRLPTGQRVAEPVSLIDLPATILTLADPDRKPELPGLPLITTGEAPGTLPHSTAIEQVRFAPGQPGWYPVSHGPLEAVTLTGWHYVRNAQGKETLLDIRTEPSGHHADLQSPMAQEVLQRVRRIFRDSVR